MKFFRIFIKKLYITKTVNENEIESEKRKFGSDGIQILFECNWAGKKI